MGTTKFMSVPYAMHAKYSDTAKVVLGSNSPWTLVGNNIYNMNAGNVGIGTGVPSSALSVMADIASSGVMTIENADTNGFAGTYFYSDSINRGYIGYVGNGGWCEKNTFQIGTFSGADFKIIVDGCVSDFTIKANTGNVGIANNDPQEKLDVNGAVRIQQNTTSPQPSTVYGNSTPIAYGSTDYFGNLGQDYGVASFTSTATGRYILTLDNPVVGNAVVVTTMWDTNNYGFINYYQPNSTTIEFRTRNGSGVDANQGFSFVVYGTPQ